MHVGRVVFDAAQREALGVEVVPQIVGVEGRLMAARALSLAEEDSLTSHFGWRRLCGIEFAEDVELGRWREVEHLLEVDLAAALERVHSLCHSDHDVAVEIGGALLELGEILDRLQGTSRAEQPLNVQAAKRECLWCGDGTTAGACRE
jgi:hypothetical protein